MPSFSSFTKALRSWPRKSPAPEALDGQPLLSCDVSVDFLDEKASSTSRKPRKLQKAWTTGVSELKEPAETAEPAEPNELTHCDCPICHEPVGQRNANGYLEKWLYLPCGHRFGSECLTTWLLDDNNREHCCPMCRRDYHCKCGHLWLPQTSLSEADRKRLEGSDPSRPVPEVCGFCDQRLRKVVSRLVDFKCHKVLTRPKLWDYRGHPSSVKLKPVYPPCESHFDVLWKAWYQHQVLQFKRPRRFPPIPRRRKTA